MLKLSSHFCGQAWRCPASSYSTPILRANILLILTREPDLAQSVLGREQITAPDRARQVGKLNDADWDSLPICYSVSFHETAALAGRECSCRCWTLRVRHSRGATVALTAVGPSGRGLNRNASGQPGRTRLDPASQEHGPHAHQAHSGDSDLPARRRYSDERVC